MNCLDCEQPSDQIPRRGLCPACYKRNRRTGTLDLYPKQSRRTGVGCCVDCGNGPLITDHQWQQGQRDGVHHKARGLCGRCYARLGRTGQLDRYPRRNADRARATPLDDETVARLRRMVGVA